MIPVSPETNLNSGDSRRTGRPRTVRVKKTTESTAKTGTGKPRSGPLKSSPSVGPTPLAEEEKPAGIPADLLTDQESKPPRTRKKKIVPLAPSGRALAELVFKAAAEHKVHAPVLLDLSGLSSVADWFFITSAQNPRQIKTIADKIIQRSLEAGVKLLGQEGLVSGDIHWALVDLGEVVAHIFNDETRAYYDLEGLWADAPRL
ncbi:MAG: ribosome silencing factor [Deltaproteobacteria bacterium]|jgi:ribosome-associated protein|nr:ribosome silencing factor [Deltaproteobacteria bacterium]